MSASTTGGVGIAGGLAAAPTIALTGASVTSMVTVAVTLVIIGVAIIWRSRKVTV